MRPTTLRICRLRTRSVYASSLVIASAIGLLSASASIAQQDDDPFAGVEEMIVTGANTAALLAPANSSAVAFDTSDLEAYGVEDLGDIAAYVPNLEIRSQNATNASFFVRGVGLQDFGANASSSVPIFQDGVPRNPSATQLVGLYDIGGLSVLKGPQGSGNFRNASAGVFMIEAAKPQPEFSGFAKVSLMQITSVDARDALRYDFEGAMGAPIFEDWISIRLSGRYSHENAFWENGCANRVGTADRQRNQTFCGETVSTNLNQISHVKPFAHKYLGEVDDYGFRGQLRIAPPDTPLDLTMRAEISRLNRDSTTGQHIGVGVFTRRDRLGGSDNQGYADPDNVVRFNELVAFNAANLPPGLPPNAARVLALQQLEKEIYKDPLDQHPYRGDIDRPGRTILETQVASMTALLDFDLFDVKINGGFIDYRKSELRDTDLSPNLAFPSQSSDQAWELYGDIELSGDQVFDVPFDWKVGGYGMTEQVEAIANQTVFDSIRVIAYQQEIYSFGVFAQGSYEFLESFTLSGGVRYNSERKDMELQSQRERLDGSIVPGFRGNSRNQRTWDYVTGFGLIRYDFTEDVGMFMKYAKGFKAGHFNPARAGLAKDTERGFADPEQLDSFEWGLDFVFWAGRLSGNTNVFYYNYKNYQVFRLSSTVNGIIRTIQNARKAINYGAELEFTLSPLEGYVPEAIEGLTINVRGGWLATAYQEFTNTENRLLGNTQVSVRFDYSGNQLISAPQLQLAVTFTWPLDLARYGTLTPQYDFTWTDDVPFDPDRGRGEPNIFGESRWQPYTVGNRAFILHNVRLSWQPPGDSGVSLSGWCRNVTDKRFLNFAVDISSFNGQLLNYVADPRICGADLRFTF